jgi:hypothetical protein
MASGTALAGPSGQELGPDVNVSRGAIMANHLSNQSGHDIHGYWQNVKSPRFLGIKFLISGETHFAGYASLSQQQIKLPLVVTLMKACPTSPSSPGRLAGRSLSVLMENLPQIGGARRLFQVTLNFREADGRPNNADCSSPMSGNPVPAVPLRPLRAPFAGWQTRRERQLF